MIFLFYFIISYLKIGKSTTFFNGFIDGVKIYPYARTAAQIKADYAERGTGSGVSVAIGDEGKKSLSDGLVGYWKMDEASWDGSRRHRKACVLLGVRKKIPITTTFRRCGNCCALTGCRLR